MESVKESIGFIGLGLMGHGIAKNIVDKGFPLTVMAHRRREAVEDLIGRGAREVATARELAASSTVIFLCVTGSAEVESVVTGPEGLLSGARPGTIIVDTSTSDPTSTVRLAALCGATGTKLADAPLSRTAKDAWEGTLETMVGCDPEVLERLRPVLSTWAVKITHAGTVGDGHRIKLINNFIALGYGALYAEALTLAQKVGLTPERVDKVISNGRMDCGFYQTFVRYALAHDASGHKFTLANALKDLRYAESMANAAGVANPVGNAVKNAYTMAINAGHGTDFVPVLSAVVAASNGVEFP